MEKILPYLKTIGITILSIIISMILISIIYYFHITNDLINNIMCIVIPLIIIFINSYKLGKKALKKGFLEGLKLGSIIILIFTIMSLILGNTFSIKVIIYYLIIMFISIFGSTLGINKNGDLEKPI